MKEKIKLVIVFILGIMISALISVYAATVITAGEVSYTSNSNTTVETGLNNLYTKANGLANRVTNLESKITGTQKLTYHTGTGTLGSNGKLAVDTGSANVFSAGAIRTNDATMVISTAVQGKRYLRFQYSEVSIPISYYYWTFETN